jgi:hypothetical protein
MKNSTPPTGLWGSLGRVISRIFLIIRTRNVYGYNSSCERIIRNAFGNRPRRRRIGGSKRCAGIE